MASTTPRRVVITGMGCITALGRTAPDTFNALIRGQSGAAEVKSFSTADCRSHIGAEVDLSEPAPASGISGSPGTSETRGLRISPRRWAKLPRASQLALIAAGEALGQAKLLDAEGKCTLHRLEISASSTAGGMSCGEAFLKRRLATKESPAPGKSRADIRDLTGYQPQSQIADLHRCFGFGGPYFIVANACASGANAIGHAWQLIRSGAAEIVLAGGFEALARLVYTGFDSLQSLSPDCCRPFDTSRNGLMLGEGAGFLILESEAHARRRNATALAEIAGYGHTTDLGHTTQPDRQGLPIQLALAEAFAATQNSPGGAVDRHDVIYVNAHGTGTALNDGPEAGAIRTFFIGEDAAVAHPDASLLSVSSTKSATGHTLGAAGSVEAILTVMSLLHRQIPPQLNLRDAEPALAGHFRTADRTEAPEVYKAAASINLGFGGSNAALLITRAHTNGNGASAEADLARPEHPLFDFPLAVLGMGAVSPAGFGAEALQNSTSAPVPGSIASIANAACTWPALRVDVKSPELQAISKNPRLRRASPLSLFLAEAARQAIAQVPAAQANPERLGIVSLFWTGSIAYSRRFFTEGHTHGARLASPALFPETVFNVPTSHVASMLGVSRWCYSLVGDEATVVTGLRTAAAWLQSGSVDYVLLLGGEELDPIALEAYARLGWLSSNSSFIPSEGAGALLLGRAQTTPASAADITPPPVISCLREGPGYRSRCEAYAAAAEVFASRPDNEAPCFVWYGTAQHNWLAPIETRCVPAYGHVMPTQPYLGEAFTASALWQVMRASSSLGSTSPLIVPFFGHNSQISTCQLSLNRS
ncbi:MAG: beta-ketoacyl-[acyl-carrier-protein] synthase family protein [Candidatus Methylacidiphilales bacterium]|nr:beta-ketoacyl-[acyl-carrier-protein] synthase family protein [Candidatus Methylacidiphilales bacterium]